MDATTRVGLPMSKNPPARLDPSIPRMANYLFSFNILSHASTRKSLPDQAAGKDSHAGETAKTSMDLPHLRQSP
jgi:hypothetical protein